MLKEIISHTLQELFEWRCSFLRSRLFLIRILTSTGRDLRLNIQFNSIPVRASFRSSRGISDYWHEIWKCMWHVQRHPWICENYFCVVFVRNVRQRASYKWWFKISANFSNWVWGNVWSTPWTFTWWSPCCALWQQGGDLLRHLGGGQWALGIVLYTEEQAELTVVSKISLTRQSELAAS